MRRFVLAALAAAVFVITFGQEGYAMSNSGPKPLAVACTAVSPKVVLPDWLCPLFIDRLAVAHPDRAFVAAGETRADVELLVSAAVARRFTAHIRWNERAGAPRGAMLSGGRLTPDMLSRTLDDMILALPAD